MSTESNATGLLRRAVNYSDIIILAFKIDFEAAGRLQAEALPRKADPQGQSRILSMNVSLICADCRTRKRGIKKAYHDGGMMQMEMLYARLNGIFGQKGAVSFDRASEGGDSHEVIKGR